MIPVCIVTPDLAGPTRNGGIGTHCLHLARFLAQLGQEVVILHTGNPDDPDRESWKNWYRREIHAELLYLDQLEIELRAPVVFPSPRHTIAHQVYHWLREQNFSAIHFQDWQGNGAICARARQTGRAFQDALLTVTAHGSDEWIREGMGEFPNRGRDSMIDDALERSAIELADLLICPTEHVRNWLQKHGWKTPSATKVIPLLSEGRDQRAHDGSLKPESLREIVFFGRLETRKGLLPFIDAVDQWAATDSLANVAITFLGRHHQTPRGGSEELIRDLQQRHEGHLAIRVIPNFDRRAALDYLTGRSDVLAVVPSLADNSPYVVIECIQRGIPLLASARGGIPELVGNKDRLVEPNAGALVQRLQSIAAAGLEPLDPCYSSVAAEEAWRKVAARRPVPASDAEPTISVVVPHFDQPAELAVTLAALARQSRPAHEVIVVDDGSMSPASATKLAALEKEYSARGWRFLRTENQGPAAARNAGAATARGEALAFIDADNLPHDEMLRSLARAMAHSGAGIVTCAFEAVRSGTEDDPEFLYCPLGGYPALALVENSLGDTNFLVRREIFHECGGFAPTNRSASEDWGFLLAALLRGHHPAVVPDPLFRYRLKDDSHARTHTELDAARTALANLEPVDAASVSNLALAARGAFFELARSVGRRDAVAHQLELLKSEARSRAVEYSRALEARAINHANELADLHRTVNGLEATITILQHKIRRMQSSFSWEVTAPLRALRRKFIDPRKATRSESARDVPKEDAPDQPVKESKGPTEISPGFKFAIDSPAIWHDLRTRKFAVRGWILREDHKRVDAVRVRCGGEVYEAAVSRRRSDVFSVAPDHPYASSAGFEVTVRASGPKGEFFFEAKSGKGPWECFFHTAWTTTREAQENPPDSYETWMRANEDFSVSGIDRLRQRTHEWPRRPLISVLMPVYNTPARWLISAVESVRAQAYENWELCIADDASTAPHIRPVIEEYARIDTRIRVTFRATNGHIAAASNTALADTTGEWTVLFDHDDELAPHALADVARTALANPDAGMIYSDEDKINEQGHRYAPYFKPDWMPDLLLGQNYVSHLVAYPTDSLKAVGGFRTGLDGSQDWDVALRITEKLSPDAIVHIPKILYHWRAIPGSTAVQGAEKGYAADSSQRAIAEHLQRTGQNAEVVKVPGLHWRVRRPLPKPAPMVSIIIPTRDMLDVLRPCVESILAKTRYPIFEIILVDNQSQEPATKRWFDEVRSDHTQVLNYPHPFNYSAINNFAVGKTSGDIVAFLNNDLEVMNEEWLEEMVSHATRPEAGCVGAMLYYPDGTVQHAGVVLGVGGVASHAFLRYVRGADGYFNRMRLVQNYSAVTGACLVMRRDLFQQMSGFDETNLTIAFNDVDLCLRVRRAGYRNVWTPYAEFVHHESVSRGLDDTPEKSQRFAREIEYMRRTWGRKLDNDPAYNPHLSLEYPDFSIATPPRMFVG